MFGIGTLFLTFVAVTTLLIFRLPWLRAMKRLCAESNSSITFALLALIPWAGPMLFYRLMRSGAAAQADGNALEVLAATGGSGHAPTKGLTALVLDLRATHGHKSAVAADDRGTQLAAVQVANQQRCFVTLAETAVQFGAKKLSPGDIVQWTPLEKPRLATIPLLTHGSNATISGQITEKLNAPPQAAPGWRRRHIAGSSRGYASRGGQGGGIY